VLGGMGPLRSRDDITDLTYAEAVLPLPQAWTTPPHSEPRS